MFGHKNEIGKKQLERVICVVPKMMKVDGQKVPTKVTWGVLSPHERMRVGVFLQEGYLHQEDVIKILKERIHEQDEIIKSLRGITDDQESKTPVNQNAE